MTLLFVQLLVILTACRVVARVFARIGQPEVVAEIFTGLLLGGSWIYWNDFNFSSIIFPVASLEPLNVLAQIGLAFFLLAVGIRATDPAIKRGTPSIKISLRQRALISQVSIAFPFGLGYLFSLFLPSELRGSQATALGFGLFLGVAFSVTAFPVLARILQERRLDRTPVGQLAISVAAFDDVAAWILLATATALVNPDKSQVQSIGWRLAAILLYMIILYTVVRPAIIRIFRKNLTRSTATTPSSSPTFWFIFSFLASCAVCEWLGIHFLFGAFSWGWIAGKSPALRDLPIIHHADAISRLFFLPIFFVLTGLKANFSALLEQSSSLFLTAAIIAVALVGKLVGGYWGARIVGLDTKSSWTLGILINTRGLMELVFLNIGLEFEIISQELFSMMVVMALVTTILTGPLLHRFRLEGRSA